MKLLWIIGVGFNATHQLLTSIVNTLKHRASWLKEQGFRLVLGVDGFVSWLGHWLP
jgi:hypothetical protein